MPARGRYPCFSRATADFTPHGALDYHAPVGLCNRPGRAFSNKGEHQMGKSQDAKKNVKKAPTKTPKEKKEAKRLKKAEKKH
jgi:hypothetical protein